MEWKSGFAHSKDGSVQNSFWGCFNACPRYKGLIVGSATPLPCIKTFQQGEFGHISPIFKASQFCLYSPNHSYSLTGLHRPPYTTLPTLFH